MSVAVAVTIRPSRTLAVLKHAMCAAVCTVGLLLMCQPNLPLSLWLRSAISLSCFFVAVLVLRKWRKSQGLYRINVDADGQIYLQQSVAEVQKNQRGARVQLLPSSTIWPGLMALRFRLIDEAVPDICLIILGDAVSLAEFRALSAALRWVAVRHGLHEAA